MSGPKDNPPRLPGAAQGPGSDPTMDDILASIRRILNEDGVAATPPEQAPPERREEVLVLDETMMVSDPKPAAAPAAPPEPPQGAEPDPATPILEGTAAAGEGNPQGRLIAPAAAAAAAAAVGGLVKRLSGERSVAVSRGGPTIEDLVREELRPLLKAWLDANLPAVVERVVRAEIERVLGGS